MNNTFSSNTILSGCYVPGNTSLHLMPVNFKLIVISALLVGAAFGGWCLLSFITLIVVFGLYTLRISVGRFARSMRVMLWFFFVVGVLPALFTPGTTLNLPDFIPFSMTTEGVNAGAQATARVFLMFILSIILTRTTCPASLIDSIEKGSAQWLGVRAREFCMVGALAFQAIPFLFAEAESLFVQKLKSEQAPRGLLERIRQVASLIIPFIVHVLSNAEIFASRLNKPFSEKESGRNAVAAEIYQGCGSGK